jgi:beta-glucanase (GH16 family)
VKRLLPKIKLLLTFPKHFLGLPVGIVLFTALIFLALPHPSRADYTWEGVPAGYGLAWTDAFNGAIGSGPNPANWTYDTGDGGWGNAELENYTTSTANSQIVADPNAIGGQALAIIALDPGGNNDAVGSYTSARLVSSVESNPNNNWQYGYMEARVKMPYGDGIWPAFWMLGNNINSGVSWPTCGEIDIMENIGEASDQANNHGSLHDGIDWTDVYTLDGPQLFHNAYHTFAANWVANQIQFYVDGNLYETVNASSQPGGTTWEFNNSFFYLLNLAVGGNYPGNPDASTSFPQTMFVNYVRTYQSGNPTPTPVVQSTWRVHCGGDNYTDGQGNLWAADTNFAGGWPSYGGTAASGTVEPTSGDSSLYQYQRYGNTTGGETVTYIFNVPNGNYQVDLKFDETYWTGAGQRQFNYSINGTTKATNFDIYAAAGGANKALDEIYNNITPNGSGQIVIQFTQGAYDNPTVGGIQVIPTSLTATSTPTASATPSPSATATKTSSFTATNTVANTATSTLTSSPTVTRTHSPTNTATSSPTASATKTASSTATNMATNTVTSTPTNTATHTSTFTATSTVTNTLVNTATKTATLTVTSTGTYTTTATITHTLANTATNTATASPSNTPTKTDTSTPTNTLANTSTNTATKTATSTSTNIPLNTATNTPVNTITSTSTSTATQTSTNSATHTTTATITPMPTNTNVITPTPTGTGTHTVTSTRTSTPTNTPLNTATNTPVNTVTSTSTSTATQTPTNSATHTTTATQTNTSTNSVTATITPTPSNTNVITPTPTGTGTHTVTSTRTSTPTNTPFNTATHTPINTVTSTSTSTATQTPTHTPTSSPTNSPTPTSTHTSTPTAALTPTFTPTSVTVSVTTGPAPPSNSTQLPGVTNVDVVQVLLSNPSSSTVTVNSVAISDSGSGTPSTSITGITLTNNGVPLGTITFSGLTVSFSGLSVVIPPSGGVTLQANTNFSVTAPSGTTYQFSISSVIGTNGQSVIFSGVPTTGAMVTIANATATPTHTPTITSTATNTSTSTPTPCKGVVIYPNPVTGPSVNVLPKAYSGVSNVEVEIFTISFRKVQEETFPNVPPGVAVTLQLTDKWGTPLANGLYYLVVIADGQRSSAKLLILR